jgi:NAD(P)-dependent dehydrogenase (short-subunit alcohol dehydrogenase family)
VLNRIGVGFLLEDTVNLKLIDKVVLVTGSTAGIGFAMAKSLAAEGAHVYVNGRTRERVEAAVATIRSQAASGKVDGICGQRAFFGHQRRRTASRRRRGEGDSLN